MCEMGPKMPGQSRAGYFNLAFVSCFWLGLCAQGCGSSPTPPTISNFSLSPGIATLGTAGGKAQVSLQFTFEDVGGDLSSLTITKYDADGILLYASTGPLNGTAGQTSGQIGGTMKMDTQTEGHFVYELFVTDSAGAASNKLTATFVVS